MSIILQGSSGLFGSSILCNYSQYRIPPGLFFQGYDTVSCSGDYTVFTYRKPITQNCILWLDAKDPNNTGIAPANNSTITTWYDKSGYGNNASANSPIIYNKTGLNSYPALTFTGSQWLTGNVSNTKNTMTIFVICSMNSSSEIYARTIGFSNGNGILDSTNNSFMCIARNASFGIQPWRNGSTISNDPPNYSTPYLSECWFDGTSVYSTVQIGNSTIINNMASSGNFGISYFTIGNDTTTASSSLARFNGSISEILVYNTSLSTTDRQKVEGYLSWKWGLQNNLKSDHPYYSNLPSNNFSPLNLTNSVTNAISYFGNYNINILAIGGGGAGGYPTNDYPTGGALNYSFGGGGGAGGLIQKNINLTDSDNISIIIGNGGLLSSTPGKKSGSGFNTSIIFNNYSNDIIAYGGGAGGSGTRGINSIFRNGLDGGSGGGGTDLSNGFIGTAGLGVSGQGYPGAIGKLNYCGGGGGAGGPGDSSGNGGIGVICTLPGISSIYPNIYWAGGGAGSLYLQNASLGAKGGAGGGSSSYNAYVFVNSSCNLNDLSAINYPLLNYAATNTGGGGSGGNSNNSSNGGSGIVVISTLTSNLTISPINYIFCYSGSDQYLTIPYGYNFATINCWGAGGAIPSRVTNTSAFYVMDCSSGGGGFTSSKFTVTGYSKLKVIVGQGGISRCGYFSSDNTYGGGGGQILPFSEGSYGTASGGGRTAVQLFTNNNYFEIITAGGGGGGAFTYQYDLSNNASGGSGGGTIGGNATNVGFGGSGGTQSSGGTAGTISLGTAPTPGSQFQGGIGGTFGAGGGGGYYGGGGGGCTGTYGGNLIGGGGGGGSSYINSTYQTIGFTGTMLQANGYIVANNTGLPSYFQNSIGNGTKGNGLTYNSGSISNCGKHGFATVTLS